MGIIIKLCGEQFWLAFCEAKDVTRAIKNGGEDFNKKCPPALISHFINGLSWEHSLPNPAPVCAFSFMLIVVCVCSAHFAFDKFILYLKSDLVIAIIMVVLCRWVMNGETFTMMIRFCLGRRLVRVALKEYLTSQTRK
ncbi:TPA: hypothetical protein JDD71_003629 [Salmonella enterica subsp. salamae]|nr:hypothetical protein [Salmonella enterica subsp. salamae]